VLQSKKHEKGEVGFEHPAKGKHHCSQCRHFEVQHKNGCEVVRGYIEGPDWCRLWKKISWIKESENG
jgi:hypothetical protein